MTGIHFILFLLPKKYIRGKGDALSHRFIMTQWSTAVSSFLSRLQNSAGQHTMKQPKLFSKCWDIAEKQQGSRGPAVLMGEQPLRQLLTWSFSCSYCNSFSGGSDPYLHPSPISLFRKSCSPENMFSVHKLIFSFSHTNLRNTGGKLLL